MYNVCESLKWSSMPLDIFAFTSVSSFMKTASQGSVCTAMSNTTGLRIFLPECIDIAVLHQHDQ